MSVGEGISNSGRLGETGTDVQCTFDPFTTPLMHKYGVHTWPLGIAAAAAAVVLALAVAEVDDDELESGGG